MDTGQKMTRKTLKKVDNKLIKKYESVEQHLRKQVQIKMANFAKEDAKQLLKVSEGKLTEEAYRQWRTRQLTASRWVNSMAEEVATNLTKANASAVTIASKEIDKVYEANVKAGLAEVATVASVALPPTRTLAYIEKVKTFLPVINESKDIAYNMRIVKSAIMQGVTKGESVPKMAKRIANVTGQSKSASLRTARTAINSAHNGGRLESYQRAVAMGINIEKQWMATADSRTRKSHLLMNGETVPVNEEFSNGLMFPQDPSGEPAEVYNCRCTMIAVSGGKESDVDLEELME